MDGSNVSEKDFCFWASGRKCLSKDLYEKWDKRQWIVVEVRNQGESRNWENGNGGSEIRAEKSLFFSCFSI